MKKTNLAVLLMIASFAFAVAGPSAVRAESLVETETTASVQADVDSGPSGTAPNLRATLKARIEAEAEARNKTLRERLEDRPMLQRASTTLIERKEIRDERKDEVRDIRTERKEDVRNASTSAERWGIRREALLEAFRARQTAFVKQLELSIRNLEQIAGRITDRIGKLEQEGKDMTDTKALMVTATAKIDAAKTAVDAVAAYVPPTSASATTTVDLDEPRSIGEDATKAVREARDALKKVVESIVRIMGLDLKASASSTSSQ